jgi:hypothetical protein
LADVIAGGFDREARIMATGEDLRRAALALEGTVEAPHFDRAAFRVARIYATLAADGLSANLKLSPDEQEFKCLLAPDAFAPVPNAWGRQGWTTALLARLDQPDLASALEMAWKHALPRRRIGRRPSSR